MIAINSTEFARNCTSNTVYPLSIEEGFQDGNVIFSDDSKAALFWHYCGFAYLSGRVEESFLEKISQGKKPVWAHAIANEGSKYTALGVGFLEDRVNTVIRKK
jgi:hypothetical protein